MEIPIYLKRIKTTYTRLLILLLCLKGFTVPLFSDDWLNSSPTGKISIKNLSEIPVIEAEVADLSQKEISRAFRLASRYVTISKSPLRYPIILTFPQWSPTPETPRPPKIFLQMVLNSFQNLPEPTEKGLKISSLTAGTVSALAIRGAYDSEEWLQSLQTLMTHLHQVQVPPSGTILRMLYHNPDVTPSFWRLSEVLVPIPTLQP